MTSTETPYLRVRIHGELICGSPLHIGNGTSEAIAGRDRTCAESVSNADPGQFAAVCVAHNGLPYLPGSTLRGFLRGQVRHWQNQGLERRLFGYVDDEADADEIKRAKAGALRIYNAPLRCAPDPGNNRLRHPVRGTLIRHGVAIHPITSTADEHKLFSQEYLPEGSRFAVALEAEKLGDGDLEILLGLLEALDGGAESTVGRGASRMQGRLAWTLERVEVLDDAALAGWLASDQPLDTFFRHLEPPAATRPQHKPELTSLPFRIHPLAPILVNDPSYARRKPSDGGPKESEDAPNLEFSRTADGHPLIPAASLRGLVRGRARRILATLLAARGVASQHAGGEAERWVEKLFGHQKARSPVWLGDAVSETTATPHPQHFNAIDRFTGGVAEGKLYQVEARTGGTYSGEIGLEQGRLDRLAPVWWKGLLFLILRDALEGDLVVGWGKARGYGGFRLTVEWEDRWIESWPDLLAYLDEQSGRRKCVQTWIDSLHDIVDHIATDLNAKESRP